MKKNEMNSVYGKSARRIEVEDAASIHNYYMPTIQAEECIREILKDYFVDWMVEKLMCKFWNRGGTIIFNDVLFISLRGIQYNLDQVMQEYFTDNLIEEIMPDIYKRCTYEMECNYQEACYDTRDNIEKYL